MFYGLKAASYGKAKVPTTSSAVISITPPVGQPKGVKPDGRTVFAGGSFRNSHARGRILLMQPLTDSRPQGFRTKPLPEHVSICGYSLHIKELQKNISSTVCLDRYNFL
jgi:hypothetical protein